MSGHVFHPGHAELHGITVIVETTGTRTYVGRYDKEDELGVHVLNVGIHDQASDPTSRDDYLRSSIKFGIRSEHKHVVVPPSEVVRIRRLVET